MTNAFDDPQQFIFSSQGNWLLGILVGSLFAGLKWWEKHKVKLAKPEQRTIRIWPQDRVGDMVIYAAIFGFSGAKLFDILEAPSNFFNALQAVRDGKQDAGSLLFSGLTFYGGLIVATIAVLYYTNKHKIPTKHMIDAAAPALMLAYAMGRVGCQLSGDGDWGIVNLAPKPEWMSFLPDWMWSYNYPHNVIDEGVQIAGCNGPHCYQLPQGVFPTPFYEVVMSTLLFVGLWLIRKRVTIPGMLFCIYLVVNGIERFTIEKIRVNSTYTIFGHHITQAELISSLMIIAGIIGISILAKSNTHANNHQPNTKTN